MQKGYEKRTGIISGEPCENGSPWYRSNVIKLKFCMTSILCAQVRQVKKLTRKTTHFVTVHMKFVQIGKVNLFSLLCNIDSRKKHKITMYLSFPKIIFTEFNNKK